MCARRGVSVYVVCVCVGASPVGNSCKKCCVTYLVGNTSDQQVVVDEVKGIDLILNI